MSVTGKADLSALRVQVTKLLCLWISFVSEHQFHFSKGCFLASLELDLRVSVCACCLLPCCWIQLKWAWLCWLYSLPSGICRCWWEPSWSPFLQALQSLFSQPFLIRKMVQSQILLVALHWMLSSQYICVSLLVSPWTGRCPSVVFSAMLNGGEGQEDCIVWGRKGERKHFHNISSMLFWDNCFN